MQLQAQNLYFNGDLEVKNEITVVKTNVSTPGKITINGNTDATLQLKSEDVALAANEIIGAIEFYGSDGTTPGAGVKSSILARNGDQVGGTGNKSNLIFGVSPGSGFNNTEAMRINPTGSIAIDGATKYGTSGQVLTSAGDAPPTWETPTNTTYTAGNGITFTGTPATVINADINYISYSGTNNFIVYGTQNNEGTTIPTGSQIIYADASGTQIVSRGFVSDLPFTNNSGDLTAITVGNGLAGTSLSGPIPDLTMSGSYTGNFTVTGDITASGGNAWLTAQGNVAGHNPPLSQGTALGWNYSSGSAEANLFFKGNTTDHADNQLRVQSYNGTTATEVIRLHGNKLVDFKGNASAEGTTFLYNSGATSYLAANKYTLIGNHSNPGNTAATFYDQAGQGPTISGFAVCFRTGSTPAQTGKLNSSGTFTVSGDVIAYGSPSDVRLKENIKPIKSALDKISKLQGVTFDWKNKSENILDIKEDIGFIAQDVQKVLPELVRENKDGMLSMRHQGIAPILLEAIKELKAEIEELKLNKCNCNK